MSDNAKKARLEARRRDACREDAPMFMRMLAQDELEGAGELAPGEYVDDFQLDEHGRLVVRIGREVAGALAEGVPATGRRTVARKLPMEHAVALADAEARGAPTAETPTYRLESDGRLTSIFVSDMAVWRLVLDGPSVEYSCVEVAVSGASNVRFIRAANAVNTFFATFAPWTDALPLEEALGVDGAEIVLEFHVEDPPAP